MYGRVTLALLLALAAFRPAGAWAEDTQLRVGVVDRAASVEVACSTPAEFTDARGRVFQRIAAMQSWSASSQGGRLQLSGPNSQSIIAGGPIRLVPLASGGVPLVLARSRWYRGTLELRAAGGGVTAINRLSVEQYLYGVVPSEMPRSWNRESLKSQAVAARSYALANLGKHHARGYDLCATDDCQMYGGASAESLATNQAVDATRGQVLEVNGRVVSAYFFSSGGGYTDNAEDVWTQHLSYIKAVPDFDQNSPHFAWYKNVSAAAIASGLSRMGLGVGEVVQVVPVTRSYSGRIKDIEVVGTAATRRVSGENFRIAAGLGSTLFNVAPVGAAAHPSEFAFAGRGFGHGLGMSQWGAKALGDQGYTYLQILGHYYPGAQLGQEE